MAPSDPTKPIPDGARRLTEFMRESVGDQLRSVVWYDQGDFEILHARDDVMTEYSEEDVEDVIDELAMDALTRPIKESLYTHGDLDCTVECYEDGIEMHFTIDRGEGIAIGLEPAAFVTHNTFIGKCLEEAALDE